MKRGFICTRRFVVIAGLATIAAASALVYRRGVASGALMRSERLAATEARLNAQISSSEGYSDSKLRLVRQENEQFQRRLGSTDSLEQLNKLLGARWSVETSAVEDQNAFPTWSLTCHMQSPTVADWRGIVQTVSEAEALPGAQVTQFDMATDADSQHPTVEVVRIVVSVRTRGPARKPGPL
jgi:hypothetical protein